jgi:hypothetical protein
MGRVKKLPGRHFDGKLRKSCGETVIDGGTRGGAGGGFFLITHPGDKVMHNLFHLHGQLLFRESIRRI